MYLTFEFVCHCHSVCHVNVNYCYRTFSTNTGSKHNSAVQSNQVMVVGTSVTPAECRAVAHVLVYVLLTETNVNNDDLNF